MITPRQESLLASIIEGFIQTADPVSSKFLEKSGFFGLSSATIRSEMNELEELGYLYHIHTSSGRVPTDMAYRFYVDKFIDLDRIDLAPNEKARVRSVIFRSGTDPMGLSRAVAQLAAEMSNDLVVTNVLEEDEFYKTGLSNLFELPEFREFDKIFRLASFFDEFESVFKGLAEELQNNKSRRGSDSVGIKVFIGRENSLGQIKDETMILTKYNLPHGYTGSITLVGPTRMDYARNIGLVKYMAEELNKIAKKA